MEYNLSLTLNPSIAILSYSDQFVIIECRISQVRKHIIDATIKHIFFLKSLKKQHNLDGYLQLRKLFYNDKSGDFLCQVDYLTEDTNDVYIVKNFEKSIFIIDGQPTYFEYNLIESIFISEHFDQNHNDYYKRL